MVDYLMSHASVMGISMTEEQAKKFVRYHELLVKANSEFNLTRISPDVSESCDRNYLDCITVLTHLQDAQSFIDVGSGAGFPGIPVAIMHPDMKVTLIDALGKRVAFLQSVISELGLNATAIHIRSEEAAKKNEFRESFDVASARAVAEMNILTEWLMPFVKVGGRMLVLKGEKAEEETAAAKTAIDTLGGGEAVIFDAPIPGRDWNHKIVEIAKIAPTPDRFPRKPGIAEKRPIVNP